MAEVLTSLSARDNARQQELQDALSRVAKLDTYLASTSQADVLESLHTFTEQVRQTSYQLMTVLNRLSDVGVELNKTRTLRKPTEAVPAAGTLDVVVGFPSPFTDNSYTVSINVSEPGLSVSGWTYLANGTGLTVTVFNSTGSDKAGTIHLTAQHD